MPLSVAQNAITSAFASLGDNEELEIDLFGGEPFLQFDLINAIFTWVTEELTPTKPYLFFATTNGVFVHKKIKHWLAQHSKKFYCCLSVDGTKEMHDANRSNSFDKIDLDFFQVTWPDQYVKMTISNETLPHLYEGYTYLANRGFLVECNLAEGISWTSVEHLHSLYQQLIN